MLTISSPTHPKTLRSLALLLLARLAIGLLLFAAISLAPVRAQIRPFPTTSAEEVARYAAMLPEKPTGVGPTINERATWDALGRQPAFNNIIRNAETFLNTPPPPWSDDVYLEFSRTGVRTNADRVNYQWIDRLAIPTLAEMIENRGRFLPAIERDINAFLKRKTWISPAHENPHFSNLKGTFHDGDIYSSHAVWVLATIDHWLGSKLSSETRQKIRETARIRLFETYLKIVREGGDFPAISPYGWSWMSSTGNHNSAGTAAVLGSGLILLESREERALLLAGAQKSVRYYLEGFPSDGYCSEGLGYWNYGFSSYFLVAETLLHATNGKINIYQAPIIRTIANYAPKLEMNNGLYPIYADGTPESIPNRLWLLDLIQRRLDVGRPEWLQPGPTTSAITYLYFLSTNAAVDRSTPPIPDINATPSPLPLRDVFPESQIYTLRPQNAHSYNPRNHVPETENLTFTAAFKGGHNNEYHNHNDIGGFVVGVGPHTPILDPGREIYNARTFGPHRYESPANNSFGHSVPVVAGRLQSDGAQYAARVLREHFTDAEDQITLDLRGAYDVPSLERLTRTFTYNRQGKGTLTVRDEVAFHKNTAPQQFGTALITAGKWSQTASDRILIADRAGAVEVVFSSNSNPAAMSELAIFGVPVRAPFATGQKVTRICIDFARPIQHGDITMTIRPLTDAAAIEAISRPPSLPEGRKADERAPIRIEAETMVSEKNGKTVSEFKVGSSGSALKYWDDLGHSIQWDVNIPKTGTYAMRIRYCLESPSPSTRTATIDGIPFGNADTPFLFETTGGWGNSSDDWQTAWLSDNNLIAIMRLSKGKHSLTMTNAGGALNIDWIEFVPVN